MNFKHLTIGDFVKQLASKQPLPAGGSASAICGAMGAALTCMTVKGAVDKGNHATLHDHLEATISISDQLKERFVNFLEKEAEVNNTVREVQKHFENISDEEPLQTGSLEQAYKKAARVHLEILNAAEDLIEISILPIKHGYPDAITDAAAGAYMAWAAAGIAAMNIRFNSSFVHDIKFVNKIMSETEFTLERIQSISKTAEELINNVLESGRI